MKNILAGCIIFIGISLLAVNAIVVYSQIQEAALAADPPIEWITTWQPDKETYAAGDIVRFTVTRRVEFDKDKDEALLLTFDSYKNVETDETYPGETMGRVVTESGTKTVVFARQLPNFLRSGTYIIEGWEMATTTRRTLPASYKSEPFKVR